MPENDNPIAVVDERPVTPGRPDRARGFFWCGYGHVYVYGTEDWHFTYRQFINESGIPIPTMCQADGTYCMDSSHIVGPFDTERDALTNMAEYVGNPLYPNLKA